MEIMATIAERKIREAMEKGEFNDLSGKGKPLTMEDDTGIPAELRMAYKVLKNAGFVPPEVELRREIVSLREMLTTLEDDNERRKKQRELDFKLLKLSMMRPRPLNLEELPPPYRDKIVDKLT